LQPKGRTDLPDTGAILSNENQAVDDDSDGPPPVFNPLAGHRIVEGGGDAETLPISDADAEALLAAAVQGEPSDTEDSTDWKAEAEKYKELAQKNDIRAKQNAQAAQKAKTVEQQLEELRGQLTERDRREVERNGRLALAQLNTRLAENGIKKDDVAGLLKRIKADDLLADGEPDEGAIAELTDSLVRITGRATPDPDQGRKGGKAPLDMNQLIRRAAGVIQ
jgi:hypothetical protein